MCKIYMYSISVSRKHCFKSFVCPKSFGQEDFDSRDNLKTNLLLMIRKSIINYLDLLSMRQFKQHINYISLRKFFLTVVFF